MINIEIDSRLIKPGDTFVAIKGNIYDGHKYIKEAIKNGATKVIVSNNKKYSVTTVNVDDTSKYLHDYLINMYSKEFEDITFVGLTGTNGKTTTAFMTYQLLRKLNKDVAYIGTIGFYANDEYQSTLNTTPDILNLYKYILKAKQMGIKTILIEASSIALNEGRMDGLLFDIAVFTNLTHDHLDYHFVMSKYLGAKLILFQNLKPNGLAIINNDDKYGKFFIGKNTITYGFNNADIKCIEHDKICQKFIYSYKGRKYHLSSPLFGKYNIYNAMAVVGILTNLGIDIKQVNEIYPTLEAPNGRINQIKYKDNLIIIDYAHTPDAVEQVLTAASNLTSGKTYVVFGCPGDRDKAKRPVMGKIVQDFADYFIVTDDDPHYEDEMEIIKGIIKDLDNSKFEVIVDRKKAIEKGFSLLNHNDTLMILGKGHESEIIIKDKPIKHNDLEYTLSLINKTEE